MTQANAQRPANWQPVLRRLIQTDRRVFAIKLWAAVCGYRNADGRPDLARAMNDIEAIRCHTRPLPDGSEHPDLPEADLFYYRDEPWRERPQWKSLNRLAFSNEELD